MKYVRTEYGVYTYERFIEDSLFFGLVEFTQADTIEELCNKFVLDKIGIIILNKEHTQYRFEDSDEWFNITETELKKGIYGAIWNYEGLIYVAKMNDKGELELL